MPFTYTCIDLYFIYIFNVISQFQDFYLSCIFIYTQLHVHVSANMNLLNISSYMHILKTLITTNNQGTMHFWIFFVICNALFMHLSKCIFAWPSLIKIYNNHSKLMFWIINYSIYWGKCYPYWNSLRVVDFRQNINAWIASFMVAFTSFIYIVEIDTSNWWHTFITTFTLQTNLAQFSHQLVTNKL